MCKTAAAAAAEYRARVVRMWAGSKGGRSGVDEQRA